MRIAGAVLAHLRYEKLARELAPGEAEDDGLGGQDAHSLEIVQCGKDLAARQISGRAEYYDGRGLGLEGVAREIAVAIFFAVVEHGL